MTLLVIDKEKVYHFVSPDDAQYWLESNPAERESIVFYPEDEFDLDFQDFLEDHYPLEIVMK